MSNLAPYLEKIDQAEIQRWTEIITASGQQNTGAVPWSEAVVTLNNVLDELRGSEAEGLNDMIPFVLRKTIIDQFNIIQNHLPYVSSGHNGYVQVIIDAINTLHSAVWQGGFRFRGKKVLGYEEKYRRMTEVVAEIEQFNQQKAIAISEMKEISKAKEEVEADVSACNDARFAIEKTTSIVEEVYARLVKFEDQAGLSVEQVEHHREEASSASIIASAKAESAEKNEQRLQDFINRVDYNEGRLAAAVTSSAEQMDVAHQAYEQATLEAGKRADEFIVKARTDVEALILSLKEIEEDIKEKLQKATGVSLFYAFDSAAKWKLGHYAWATLAAISLFAPGYYSYQLLSLNTPITNALLIKIGLGLPALLFAGFCLQQYGKERRLKEEYAFKSKISLSLQVYRKEVEKAMEGLSVEDRARLVDFLLTSIGTIFESPTERVFGSRRLGGPTDTKIIGSFIANAKNAKEVFTGQE